MLSMGHIVTPLFVPGDKPERYAKAANSGADAIIIDLEDAVSPDNKIAARYALVRPGALPSGIRIYVRVNAAGTPWHAEDIAALADLPVSAILLPKAESPHDIEQASNAAGCKPVIALLESALGLAMARQIAACACVPRLAFGSIDYCADLGMAHLRDALLTARCEIVLASRLAALAPPLDGVTPSLDDAALLEDDARYASNLGFGGKLCIHPRQIDPVRGGFAPTAEELAWAKTITDACEQGAVQVNGAMVDAPVRARARHILQRAGQQQCLKREATP
jgi:citrate lyase subunit beta/citryl-CoA lyase